MDLVDTPARSYEGDDPFVFVSYAHSDGEAALRWISLIQSTGVNVVYDEGIRPGSEWNEYLAQSIASCSTFIYLLGRASATSRYCQDELVFAISRQRPVLAIHFEKAELSPGLQLQLGARQAIHAWTLGPTESHRKIAQALKVGLTPAKVAITPGSAPTGERGDKAILADFHAEGDPSLARLITETVRVDLQNSTHFRLVTRGEIDLTLRRMQADPSTALTTEVAREIAIRNGIELVISGSVGRIGTATLLIATIESPGAMNLVRSFRRTALSDDQLINEIEGLSHDLRKAAGESATEVAESPALSEVTTTSIEALRLYTEAINLEHMGKYQGAIDNLRQAVALDLEFGMAHRKLAYVLRLSDAPVEQQLEAIENAYRFRHRMTHREMLITTATYHDRITGNVQAQVGAYERVLEAHPDDAIVLVNLARTYAANYGRYADAIELLERGFEQERDPFTLLNLPWMYQLCGNDVRANETQAMTEQQFPGLLWTTKNRFLLAYNQGNLDTAMAAAVEVARNDAYPGHWRSLGDLYQALILTLQQDNDAATQVLEASAIARGANMGPRRLIDLAWLEIELFGRGERGRSRMLGAIDNAMDDYLVVYGVIRNLLYLGDVSTAASLMDRWEHGSQASSRMGFEEDWLYLTALSHSLDRPETAVKELSDLMRQAMPIHAEQDWPSVRKSQRCYQYDIAKILDRAGQRAEAVHAYRTFLKLTNELIETPVLKMKVKDRLKHLESNGSTPGSA